MSSISEKFKRDLHNFRNSPEYKKNLKRQNRKDLRDLLFIVVGGCAILFSLEYASNYIRNKLEHHSTSELGLKVDAYETNLNNDNRPDWIIKEKEGYTALISQEDGSYKIKKIILKINKK